MTEQLEGQMSIFDCFDRDIWSGRTCQEPSAQTKEKTSTQSCKKPRGSQTKMPLFLNLTRGGGGHLRDVSWEMGGLLLGEYTMRSFGEYPSEERGSRLSQILEVNPHPKYSLSPRACQGILNRAERRGKELPAILKEALIRQATPLKSGGGVDVDSHGKKAGKGALVQTELSGTLGVSQDQTLITKQDVKAIGFNRERCGAVTMDDAMPTIQATAGESGNNQPMVVYGISSYESNAMKSPNPHSGIYEADTTRTLDNNGGNPACNQGGMIVLEGNGSRESHRGDGYKESEVMYSLNTVEQHAVVDTYQKTTGSLCASGYDKLGTQEAANDMYVVQSCSWDGQQVSPTLTKNNAGGGQRMPDKENFNAVIQGINGDIAGTLDASYYKGCGERQGIEREVVYGIDRASFNQGKNAQYDFAVDEDLAQTLVSRGPGGVLTKQ